MEITKQQIQLPVCHIGIKHKTTAFMSNMAQKALHLTIDRARV